MNVEARAEFIGWLKETYDTYIVYYFQGAGSDIENSAQYRPSWLPDGYIEVQAFEDSGNTTICYKDNAGHILTFSYLQNSAESAWYIDAENSVQHPISIGSAPGEIFIYNNPDTANVITWEAEDGSMAFHISAFLEEPELLRMAESVNKS